MFLTVSGIVLLVAAWSVATRRKAAPTATRTSPAPRRPAPDVVSDLPTAPTPVVGPPRRPAAAVDGSIAILTMPEPLEDALRNALADWTPTPDLAGPGRATASTAETLLAVFTAQVESRATDLVTRELRGRGRGYYSIASAGHEANAAVAAALRPTDPALLHYRSGAFYTYRAHQVGGIDPVRDILLGVMGAADEPISAGRHKVFGRHELAVIPQTSTIASHLPRSFGLAFAIERAARLGVAAPLSGRRRGRLQLR